MMIFTDALLLSSYLDATLIVAKVGKVSVKVLSELKERFDNIHHPIIGVVMHMIPFKNYSYYHYDEYYYYKEKEYKEKSSS
jgi:Mrp family chromosome partitioning ATPase